jgi:PAS domain S-box-containing protein
MVLLDERRRHVEVNGPYLQLLGYRRGELVGRPIYEIVAGGPVMSTDEWHAALAQRQFTGIAVLVCSGGRRVTIEFAGHPEVVTGQRLVLGVALRTGRATRQPADVTSSEAEPGTLSKREHEVVRLLSEGANGPEVAEALQLTHNTVRTHARNAMIKLGARTRAQLVAMALAEGRALSETP